MCNHTFQISLNIKDNNKYIWFTKYAIYCFIMTKPNQTFNFKPVWNNSGCWKYILHHQVITNTENIAEPSKMWENVVLIWKNTYTPTHSPTHPLTYTNTNTNTHTHTHTHTHTKLLPLPLNYFRHFLQRSLTYFSSTNF